MYDDDWIDDQVLADLLGIDLMDLYEDAGGYVTADEAVEIVLEFGGKE